jgi:hypothetical protein
MSVICCYVLYVCYMLYVCCMSSARGVVGLGDILSNTHGMSTFDVKTDLYTEYRHMCINIIPTQVDGLSKPAQSTCAAQVIEDRGPPS